MEATPTQPQVELLSMTATSEQVRMYERLNSPSNQRRLTMTYQLQRCCRAETA